MSTGPREPSTRGHRRPSTILVDADDPILADALAAAFAPHRVHVEDAASAPDAVTAVATRAADLVVVAPGDPAIGPGSTGDDARHRAVALRSGWWAAAAGVVGARVVLVVGLGAFDTGGSEASSTPPDEFSRPVPTTPRGRTWRAAEVLVRAAGGTVVRVDDDLDAALTAGLVRWAATAPAGTWHGSGAADLLDDRHTRLVRAEGGHDGRGGAGSGAVGDGDA